MKRDQILDPASIGVSFVDILFALAVGQVFAPLAQWAQDPAKNPLPSRSWFHLGVALAITITSWIGYHASANKARFQLQFFNVELVKLVLDISMVAVYFMLAAYAVRLPVEAKPETLLVLLAFVLYACWDLASAYQKRDRPDNKYRREWDKVLADPARPDVIKEWQPTDWGRVWATWVALVLVGGVGAYTWFLLPQVTPTGSIVIDVLLLVILVVYRILKEWAGKPPAATEVESPFVAPSAHRHGVGVAVILHAFDNPIQVENLHRGLTRLVGSDQSGNLYEIGVVNSEQGPVIVRAMAARS